MQIEVYKEFLVQVESSLLTLPDKPEESAKATIKALWFAAYGEPKSAQLAETLDLPALNAQQIIILKQLIQQRMNGVPLAHITGRQQFLGIELLAGPGALIPRKETELLGRTAISLLSDILNKQKKATVLDVCTGAGNLPIAYAMHHQFVDVLAADLCVNAVAQAAKNIAHHGLQNRVKVHQGDLLSPFDKEEYHKKIDLLTCNPPYISSAKVSVLHAEIIHHEPQLAFDGGPFGIKILSQLIQQAPKYLKQGGWLAFELGLGQGPSLMKLMMKNTNYLDVKAVNDDNGDIRVIMARV